MWESSSAVLAPLAEAGIVVEVFDGSEAEPSLAVADASIRAARQFKPDAIVGLGGGSNMDLAKIHGHRRDSRRQPGRLFRLRPRARSRASVDLRADHGGDRQRSFARRRPDRHRQRNEGQHIEQLAASQAGGGRSGTDLQLPKTSDRRQWHRRAPPHAIEAYTATDYSKMHVPEGELCAYEGRFPVAEIMAEKAIALVGRHLVTAVQEPTNTEARDGMALAATLSRHRVFECRRGIGSRFGVSAGGRAPLFPRRGERIAAAFCDAIQFARTCRDIRANRRTSWRSDRRPADRDCRGTGHRARRAIEARDRPFPSGSATSAATADQLVGFAEKAFAIKRLFWVNPRSATLEDVIGIYQDAL